MPTATRSAACACLTSRCRLGTNGGQNAPQTFSCSLVGSFSPFAATKAERERSGDARLSIEERYHGRDDYVNRVRIAAQDLVSRGLLLSEDAAVIVQQAASSDLVRAGAYQRRAAVRGA